MTNGTAYVITSVGNCSTNNNGDLDDIGASSSNRAAGGLFTKSGSTNVTCTGQVLPAALTVPSCSGTGTTLRVCSVLTPTAASTPMQVGGWLSSDVGSGDVAPYTTITALGTGTGGVGTYTVSPSQSAVTNRVITSSSNVITLTGTFPLSPPAVGTALGVASGTGQIRPDSVTGSISGTTLNVTGTTSGYPTPKLSVGDAIFGQNVKANTRITALSGGTGGNGNYTVEPGQTVASATLMVRPAVVSTASASSITLSRAPSTPLANASLCGGLCPILLPDGVTATGRVQFSGLANYDDWSGGFACVKGANPSNVTSITPVMSRQSNWREVVQ
ncbi:MAG: hypothetical protein IPH08_08325 [Rhodocyclaceae bacterium]|nr:hypothetical protein [Rhodocyclaceae bacterium]